MKQRDDKLPDTIKYPETFNASPAAKYDGVFDWSWTKGCFGQTNITPMDFDGVVERKGNFIVFETKNWGVQIPKGQEITLQQVYGTGVWTVMMIQGKAEPEMAKVWCAPGFKKGSMMDRYSPITTERARTFVSDWYQFANESPKCTR